MTYYKTDDIYRIVSSNSGKFTLLAFYFMGFNRNYYDEGFVPLSEEEAKMKALDVLLTLDAVKKEHPVEKDPIYELDEEDLEANPDYIENLLAKYA